MHNHFGPLGTSDPGQTAYGDRSEHPYRPRSMAGLVCTIAAVAVAATLGLSLIFWTFGIIAGILGFIIKVAIVSAVAAFVWTRITRRRDHYRV